MAAAREAIWEAVALEAVALDALPIAATAELLPAVLPAVVAALPSAQSASSKHASKARWSAGSCDPIHRAKCSTLPTLGASSSASRAAAESAGSAES